MKIRQLYIENYRGIQKLDWDIDSDLICLIGPGDSTKSTILSAIAMCLSPHWNLTIVDSDFHKANSAEPIFIEVTVGSLPVELLKESKFGLHVQGWNPDDGINDEPIDGDELVLSIQLQIDSSLEPVWRVLNDRNPEGIVISAKDREKLGMIRLGSYLDRDMTWNRGSALGRLTGEVDELQNALAEASRVTMASLKPEDIPTLQTAAEKVEKLGTRFGVGRQSNYRAALDIQSIRFGSAGVTLHDGDIPLRLAGLGSKRLLSFAMQWDSASNGGISLVDELEYGLEPHRIRRLVNILKNEVVEGGTDTGQVIITTHSPTVLVQLDAEDLFVVRPVSGAVEVKQVPNDLQKHVRGKSESFLARKILVCEGKTEIGFCWALDEYWENELDLEPFAFLGVVCTDGGGSETGKVAKCFSKLGYDVAVLADSDRELSPSAAELNSEGISVYIWDGDTSIEERVFKDLPLDGIIKILEVMAEDLGKIHLYRKVISELGLNSFKSPKDIGSWLEEVDDDEFRDALGKLSSSDKWFKRIDSGKVLGEIVASYLYDMEETKLYQTVDQLRDWIDSGEGC
jgi:putative ATP-dependent endonuclease of OLD family